MRVLQINSVCGYGSTGRIAADLHRLLLSQGHESVIAYGRGGAPPDITTIKIGSRLDQYWHGTMTRAFDAHGLASVHATKELVRKIDAYAPDIIHLHNLHGYYINIDILFSYLRTAGVPVVWTLHDCWAFTGHCAHFSFEGCERWRDGCYRCPQKHDYPTSWGLDQSRRNFALKRDLFTSVKNLTVVTPSQWLAKLARQSFLGCHTVKVIYNGIDLNVFKPTPSDFRARHGLLGKHLVLGVASQWGPRKGYYYFVQLADTLAEDEAIVMVGLTPQQLRKLPKNIIGITRTNSLRELAEIYTAADVFLNPTLDDNFPTVNLEALACGTPVITFDTGGSPEALDATCGRVTNGQSAVELMIEMDALKRQVIDRELCMNRANLFAHQGRYEEYLSLYAGLEKL